MAARKRSIVWSFFQAEDDRRVLCLLCMKTVLYFGHTTNMLRHLRTKHPSDFSSLDKRKPATDAAAKRRDSSCVEVTVLMDEQQVEEVEEEPVGEDGEMDGAIRGILRAAAGEGPAEGPDDEGEVPVEEGAGKDTQDDDNNSTLMPGTRKWSSVWLHYRKLGQEARAMCLLCTEKIQHRSSTSNLIRHLQHKHPIEFAQLEDHSQKRAGKRKSENPSHCPPSPTSGNQARSQIVSQRRDFRTNSSTSLEKYPGSKWSEGVRILERERELTEALRRVQQEEGRSLQLQRELLQQFREMDAERRVLQNQKCEQEQEHTRLQKKREEIQQEKDELHKEKEELQKEREELRREREELEKQKQELDSWKNGHGQTQSSEFYSC